MTPTTKKALFVVALVAVLVLVYYTVFAEPAADSTAEEKPGDSVPTSDSDPIGFPLQRGSRGANVRQWQDYLYTYRYGKSSAAARKKYVDGIFGPITESDTAKVTGSKTVPLATFIDALGGPLASSALSGLGAAVAVASPIAMPAGAIS